MKCRSAGLLLSLALCILRCNSGKSDESETDTTDRALLDLQWVAIPDGSFQMGSDEWPSEKPIHTVFVDAFEMTRTEVTVESYGVCVSAGGCSAPDSSGTYDNWGKSGFGQHPVNSVSWFQADIFCRWAGGELPSEAQWEYAATSAGRGTYSWAEDDEAPSCDKAVMKEDLQGVGCGTGRTMPVCSKPAGNTEQGLCDMAGNLWEWTADWFHDAYDCRLAPIPHNCPPDAVAPDDGSAWNDQGQFRVERGGSFSSSAFYVRAAARLQVSPDKQSWALGFRCVRSM